VCHAANQSISWTGCRTSKKRINHCLPFQPNSSTTPRPFTQDAQALLGGGRQCTAPSSTIRSHPPSKATSNHPKLSVIADVEEEQSTQTTASYPKERQTLASLCQNQGNIPWLSKPPKRKKLPNLQRGKQAADKVLPNKEKNIAPSVPAPHTVHPLPPTSTTIYPSQPKPKLPGHQGRKRKKHHLYEAKINERKKQKEANKPKRLIINPTSPPTSRSTYTYAHAGE
jgi:hypothetical protein